MKHKWFLPIALTLIVLGLLLACLIILYIHQQDKKHTIEIDDYYKQHVLELDGVVKQTLSPYYQKGDQKEPVLVHVKVGDTVQKGDPLYSYHNETLFSQEKAIGLQLDNKMLDKDQIEGQILAMETMQNESSSEKKRKEIDAQLNWLDRELEKAENNIDILKEKQTQISARIEALTVKASRDGKVVKIDKAQIEKFTDKVQSKPVLTLSDDQFFVEGTINRKQIELMEKGLKFDVIHSLNKDRTYQGEIESFDQIADLNNQTQSFLYQGSLNQSKGLYVGDEVKVNVHPSRKNHVWLPKEYVKEKIITHKNKQKLKTPEKQYYVNKVYGDQLNEEKVTVKRSTNSYYLVTEGLSSIDVIKPFKD
ncbi:HlyD family efflux transporter periplasmic adaptor subunit [Macrococcoides caseolyticum]|uniref:HlyD family efflux transporter periplasmic adaptor subunit n=1 Tax=Macrococcoides caseolyticum TaxID=69966 RepID=UPI001F29A7AA|nr:efflux RND transporter periplasmic adaptor subunit [Macrococcus caseolyticus]MCE4957283.1 efflux RND transporter periplasmic adaptor subunit [Macrococcus caseolyticus]